MDHDLHRLRRQLRRLSTGEFKTASLGGDPEQGFESSFASLGYSYIKDKAPRILDYLVGFQLLDRNQDNTKAVGVFGAKIGNQWAYIPIFFISGDLKGHELLYLKERDLFVPLKENWVDYIINRRPHTLGDPTEQKARELGGLQPDLHRMNFPPSMGKFSFDLQHPERWSEGFLPLAAQAARARFSHLFHKHEKLASALDLEPVLRASPGMAAACWRMCQQYPGIKGAFDRFYPGLWPKLAREIRQREAKRRWSIMPVRRPPPMADALLPKKETHPCKTGALRVWMFDSVSFGRLPNDLPAEDQQQLVRDGFKIKDERDDKDVSRAYRTQITQALRNPQETAVCDVLEKPGTFGRYLVIDGPVTQQGAENFVTLVRLSGGKAWANMPRHGVWVRDQETDESFRDWFDKQDSDSPESGSTYVAITPRGQATVPFQLTDSFGDGVWEADFQTHARHDHDLSLPRQLSQSLSNQGYRIDRYHSPYGARVYLDRPGGSKLRSHGGELYVPKEAKLIKVKSGNCCGSADDETDQPIEPGSILDVQMLLTEKTARLKLLRDHHEYIVEPQRGQTQRLSKQAALIRLVTQHGLREKTARVMLDELEHQGAVQYRIKYANPFDPNGGNLFPGPGSPAIPEPQFSDPGGPGNSQAPWQFPQEEFLPVDDVNSTYADPYQYDPYEQPDPQTRQIAQDAGQRGQKEVFDTAMLSGLLKNTSSENMVDRHLSTLMRSVDRLGRMLFSSYWHPERWQERYGKQDMVEMEEAMRNQFDGLGDLTLQLKEKTVEPNLEGLGEPSVEDVAEI